VPAHPEALLPLLAETRPLIAAIHDPTAERKLKELDDTIVECASLWLDAAADRGSVTPGASLKVSLTALVRSPVQVTLLGAKLTGMDGAPALDLAPSVLVFNQPSQHPLTVRVPESQKYSQPYWLEKPKDGALYTVPGPSRHRQA